MRSGMRSALKALLSFAAVAVVACASLASSHATGTGAESEPAVDPAPCLAAIAAGADDRIIADCGALIESDKTARADRIKALTVRGGAFVRSNQADRAIADYDALLRLDPSLTDIFNARGELYWKKGDRPRALADFSAALKLDPNHAAAKDNYRRLALELERMGAMMAVAGKPSFNCATTRRAIEKAICADPDLADLDREINAANARLLRAAMAGNRGAVRDLERQQEEFVAHRNASFGTAGYDLAKAMRERLDELQRKLPQ
jgi:tetratricopeptide (TPR) repeat protein